MSYFPKIYFITLFSFYGSKGDGAPYFYYYLTFLTVYCFFQNSHIPNIFFLIFTIYFLGPLAKNITATFFYNFRIFSNYIILSIPVPKKKKKLR